MTFLVRPYTPTDASSWDDFCSKSLQATLLHTRNFLSYHGNRFVDRSLLIEQNGKLLGVLPAALSSSDDQIVVSHPGATYGGIVHQGNLRGDLMISTFKSIIQHYAAMKLTTLIYKSVPTFYHKSPAQDDLYALFRLGAKCMRRDISSTIDLHYRLPVSERRRRSFKKSNKAGVAVVSGYEYLEPLWDVLKDNLQRKHGICPTHSLVDIKLLAKRFPENIQCICGVVDGKVEAGTLLFITANTYHAQYIASSENGYDVAALDGIFEYCIQQATINQARWFDFGISTEDDGTRINEGLYRFKTEFGAGTTTHEFFNINLQSNYAT